MDEPKFPPYLHSQEIKGVLNGSIDPRDLRHDFGYPFSRDEVLEALRGASWETMEKEEKPKPTPQEWERIGRRKMPCPLCGDSGSDDRILTISSSGFKLRTSYRCVCRYSKRYYSVYDKMCPPIFRDVIDFGTLAPSKKSHMPIAKQQMFIDLLKAKPGCSYLICGPGGWGKTAFSIALLQFAISDWVHFAETGRDNKPGRGVYRTTVSQLLDEWATWKRGRADGADHDPPEPLLTEGKIRQIAAMGYKPRIFLEEIDKMTINDKREDFLFSIFNAIYEVGGQLVMTSNQTPDEIANRFRPENRVPFMRRIRGDDEQGRIWNWWSIEQQVIAA
jgi:DNA replication protein DnaC